jgi:hippurate hydrolase
MIEDGLFDRYPMQAVFGAHNWPGMAAGQFALRTGPVFASSNEFRILIRGRGAHAAMSHNGIDPLPVACQMVQAFQTIITRNKRPIDAGVISVTMIRAGDATNVVADRCELQGTARAFTPAVLDLIERRMRQIAAATCEAFEATCEFSFQRTCPPTINHEAETGFVRALLTGLVGADNVLEFEPTMHFLVKSTRPRVEIRSAPAIAAPPRPLRAPARRRTRGSPDDSGSHALREPRIPACDGGFRGRAGNRCT